MRITGVPTWERVWLENSLRQLEGGGWGRGGSVYKAGCEGVMTHMEVAGGYAKQNSSCQGGHGMVGQNYCVVDGCLLSLSVCRRDFKDLLKVRPSFQLA